MSCYARLWLVSLTQLLRIIIMALLSPEKALCQEATQEFQTALKIDPRYADALYNLGTAQTIQEQYPSAIENLQAAIAIRPDFPEAELELGKCSCAQGRCGAVPWKHWKKRFDCALICTQRVPNLAMLDSRIGNTQGAVDEFRHVVALQPHSAEAHNNLGVALDQAGDLSGAIEEFQRASGGGSKIWCREC